MARVRTAIDSVMNALQRSPAPLDAETLNLLGIEGSFTRPLDRARLIDVGHALRDLLDGKITTGAASSDVLPGSTPYERASGAGSD